MCAVFSESTPDWTTHECRWPGRSAGHILRHKVDWDQLTATQVIAKIFGEVALRRHEQHQIERIFKCFAELALDEGSEEDEEVPFDKTYRPAKFQRVPDWVKLEIVRDIIILNKTVTQVAKERFMKYSAVYHVMAQLKNFRRCSSSWF